MKRKLLLLSCVLVAAALIGISNWVQRRSTAAKERVMRILALGDSYTIGEGVAETERWPVQLVNELRKEQIAVAPPRIIARTGWTTGELQDALGVVKLESAFDLVTLQIGVNDQFRGGKAETYRGAFREMLQQAIRFAGGRTTRVIVISIPDWGVTPFADNLDPERISSEIAQFNIVNREESAKSGVQYLDITPIAREASIDRNLLVADGLHPSAVMYARWTELIVPSAKAALLESATR